MKKKKVLIFSYLIQLTKIYKYVLFIFFKNYFFLAKFKLLNLSYLRTVRTRLINDVTIDTTHVQESEIKVIKLILSVHKKMSNSDVESSEESLKSINDSSDISDEEKELYVQLY